MDVLLSNKIKWFPDTGKIKLSLKRDENIFTMDGYDYLLKYLDNTKGSKGGNSNVFLICDPNDPENELEQYVVKICKKPLEKSDKKYKLRFKRELIALNKVKKHSKNNFIIKYFVFGNFLINNYKFPFYSMEKCNTDLTNYIDQNSLDVTEKITLCYYIIQGFSDLHNLGIYHRDIKSDNFLLKENVCKIGDLGLVSFREKDTDLIINEAGERIGAFGWESPEVMNKYLTERSDSFSFDCNIDTASDIFQLGKLFWFIFQGNLPIGQLRKEDFLVDDSELFNLIFRMLQYSKNNGRRTSSVEVLKEIFKPIAQKYSIT